MLNTEGGRNTGEFVLDSQSERKWRGPKNFSRINRSFVRKDKQVLVMPFYSVGPDFQRAHLHIWKGPWSTRKEPVKPDYVLTQRISNCAESQHVNWTWSFSRREDSCGCWIFRALKRGVSENTCLGEFMVGKSLLNATNVGKLLAEVHTLLNIRELTLERSRTNAVNVEKLLAGALT
uniref:zinc finger protein 391 isoform X9 n=1 Tax=Halichoerus grypus TaxID=9711 RepID=UPI001658D4EA|nr:zinc finger protein 391 isoform X9 [Halichoerus grypus]